jgi:hypothetical protein
MKKGRRVGGARTHGVVVTVPGGSVKTLRLETGRRVEGAQTHGVVVTLPGGSVMTLRSKSGNDVSERNPKALG